MGRTSVASFERSFGKVTDCRIPTLEEVIVWSKGKTIINLDKKDVSDVYDRGLIKKHRAEKHVMLTVHLGHRRGTITTVFLIL